MNIYFLRHGFALHNQEYKYRGTKAFYDIKTIDSPLVEEGVVQAKNVNRLLKDIEFDYIFSSPLLRCIQTGNLVVPEKKIILDDILLEPQGFHICNKRKDKNILIDLLKNYNNTFDFENLNENYDFRKENENDLKLRTELFFKKLKELKAKNVLVVSHHDFIKKFFKYNFNEKCYLDNCEIKKILI